MGRFEAGRQVSRRMQIDAEFAKFIMGCICLYGGEETSYQLPPDMAPGPCEGDDRIIVYTVDDVTRVVWPSRRMS